MSLFPGTAPSITSMPSEPHAAVATLAKVKTAAATVLILLAVNGALPLAGKTPVAFGAQPTAASVADVAQGTAPAKAPVPAKVAAPGK